MTTPTVEREPNPVEADRLLGRETTRLPRRMAFAFLPMTARYNVLTKYADLREAARHMPPLNEKSVRMTWAHIALMEFICGIPTGGTRQPYANGVTDEIMRMGLAS